VLQRGDVLADFEVTTLDGQVFGYSTIWQRKNLVLVTLPAGMSGRPGEAYVAQLRARSSELTGEDAACVITRDSIPGLASPAVLVADRWGEIMYCAAASEISGLPPTQELVDWLGYLRTQCPECEGEAK
jgi:peroxiredoxin